MTFSARIRTRGVWIIAVLSLFTMQLHTLFKQTLTYCCLIRYLSPVLFYLHARINSFGTMPRCATVIGMIFTNGIVLPSDSTCALLIGIVHLVRCSGALIGVR